jgi:putative Holliday junction resolvase
MKYLGIDYGSKHIGLATSDSAGQVAMPYQIISASDAISQVVEIVQSESVEVVVIGRSMGLDGVDNPIQQEINQFAAQLGEAASIPIHQMNEQFSSRAAKWGSTKDIRSNPRNTPKHQRGESRGEKRIDDKAAALILQSYLDNQ